MKPVRVAIAGAGGRMGRMLVEAALEDPGIELAAAFVRPGSEWIGRDAGDPIGRSTGVLIGEDRGDERLPHVLPAGTRAFLQEQGDDAGHHGRGHGRSAVAHVHTVLRELMGFRGK